MSRRNLLLTLAAVLGAVVLLLDAHRRRQARLTGQRLERIAQLEAQLSVRTGDIRQLATQVESARLERDRLRNGIQARVSEPRPEVPPLQPEAEGLFPPGRPYFYLPKSLLEHFVIEPFEDGALHPAAAVLLGLDAREEEALRVAYADLRTALEVEELRHFEPVNPPRPASTGTNRVVIGRITALAEQSRMLREVFYERVLSLLGPGRAPHFLRRAETSFETDLHGLASIAREFHVQDMAGPSPLLLVEYERNGERWDDKLAWPIPEAWSAPSFAHLFADRSPGEFPKQEEDPPPPR